MSKKFKNSICKLCTSAILAGCIIFLMGVYYCVIKAGIPYQDPPLELQIQYAVNMGIGEQLVKNGFILIVGSGMIRVILWLSNKYLTGYYKK